MLNLIKSRMRKFLYFLIALLGFTIATSCRVEYGCPEVEYDDKVQNDSNNTERLE